MVEFKFSVKLDDIGSLLEKLGHTFKNLEIQVNHVDQTLTNSKDISKETFTCMQDYSLTSATEIKGEDARVHFNFKNAVTNQTFRLDAKELKVNEKVVPTKSFV